MEILERKIIHGQHTLCSHINYPRFVLPRHKHVEYELMLFTGGKGKQFVGEGVADYQEGDIALIGSNVPHLHLCDSKLNPSEELVVSSGEALQFQPTVFPLSMDDLPDYKDIQGILIRSQYGLRCHDHELFGYLLESIKQFDQTTGTKRLIKLFEILDALSRCKDTRLLSETAYNNVNLLPNINEPVSRVYDYLYNHFQEKITLQELALHVNQNPTALCRYFKQRTDKTIFQCLAEIRLEHACKLLAYSNLTVSQIAYESGYNHVPFFISQFMKIMNHTPAEYRKQLDK